MGVSLILFLCVGSLRFSRRPGNIGDLYIIHPESGGSSSKKFEQNTNLVIPHARKSFFVQFNIFVCLFIYC